MLGAHSKKPAHRLRLSSRAAAHIEHILVDLTRRVELLERRPATQKPSPALPPIRRESSSVANLEMQKNDDDLGKYRKMLAVGIPQPAVRQCMLKDSIDPLRIFPDMACEATFRRPLPVKPSVPTSTIKATPQAGFKVTVDQLQLLRSGLKKTPAKRSSPRTPFSNSSNNNTALESGKRLPLRSMTNTPSSDLNRGGKRATPTNACSETEFLKQALKHKFLKSRVPETPDSPGEMFV